MKFSFFIAFRYLFSYKKKHIINIISAISTLGVMISTAVLIIVLSVFNGFEEIIHRHIDAFSVDLKITPTKGKTFMLEEKFLNFFSKNLEIKSHSRVIEEQVLVKNGVRQRPIILKAVEQGYLAMLELDELLYAGDLLLTRDTRPFAIVGFGVAKELEISPYAFSGIEVFAGNKDKKPGLNLQSSLIKRSILVSGIIEGDPAFTDNYILVPFDFGQTFLKLKPGEVSAIELQINSPKSVNKVQKDLQNMLGSDFQVRTKIQLNKTIYKMLKTEKASIFSILLFVLIIFTFNMLTSLAMLIIDKKTDIQILMSMGANISLIRQVFWLEGILIVFIGLVSGIGLGLVFSWLQDSYGLITIHSNNFITEYYPIKIETWDVLSVFLLVQVIGYVAAILPVRYITRKYVTTELYN